MEIPAESLSSTSPLAGAALRAPLRVWIAFLAMCVGMFMAILDIQIVASSLPDIQTAFGIPLDRLSWVQTAYLTAEVIAIPLTGRLTRLLSLRFLFVGAIAGFSGASLACAFSTGFWPFIAWRVVQGFCGGAVIPAVFTAGFELFPVRQHLLAAALAGLFAMLAPTLGPVVGGYITDTYSWHWLFLINPGPGLLVMLLTGFMLADERPDWQILRRLDYRGAALIALALGTLEILLKEGPKRDWSGVFLWLLLGLCLVSGMVAILRCLSRFEPVVELTLLAERHFAAGCFYSFVLGMGLYGSVYLLPLFLGLVREHTPLEIGEIMIVGGVAQLLAAPVAAAAEKKFNPVWLTAGGFALFAAGLIADGFLSYKSDYQELFWPQVMRGLAVMFCLLPTTTIALEGKTGEHLANASALFNLLRNLGGAIGIALVDTMLAFRPPAIVAGLVKRLQAGDPSAAIIVGLPPDKFHNQVMGPIDEATRQTVAQLVERAALSISFNEAWLMLGVFFALSLVCLPFLRRREAASVRTS
ncbi:MAG TPA: DHA2 family efflux MFS transporter permease subunit [Candidatus Udaeobacter sp.]|nr:DHA2 family efflux MFS transporter permease subunit [Candidatus Udaeobacter sp.]